MNGGGFEAGGGDTDWHPDRFPEAHVAPFCAVLSEPPSSQRLNSKEVNEFVFHGLCILKTQVLCRLCVVPVKQQTRKGHRA